MSFLVRSTCTTLSTSRLWRLGFRCRSVGFRCSSLGFYSSPRFAEAMAVDERMRRRPFRKVEIRAVQSEAQLLLLLEDSSISGDGGNSRSCSNSSSSAASLSGSSVVTDDETEALVRMWRAYGRTHECPVLVKKLMQTTKALEAELGEELKFAGPRGSLKGEAGKTEDRRHRAFYHTLSDPEAKLQFFAARQVACRILGSHGYLCEHCWLPIEDCMCEALVTGSLWQHVRLWVYMHPKDFLRKNNTGKLLWQALGNQVQLCLSGIQLQEDAMWAALQQAGRDHVWCVYPAKSEHEITVSKLSAPLGYNNTSNSNSDNNKEEAHESSEVSHLKPLHFIMIDGTWSNSRAMVSRLQERASTVWEGSGMPCLSLSPDEFSAIHGLRPQPSVEKTCTAAAAAQLLRELGHKEEFAGHGLQATADSIDEAVDCLSEALVGRRRRVGRPVTRSRRQDYQSNVA